MTKQKIVIKAQMTCDKCRKDAMALAGSTYGVQSVGIEGEERDQLVVVGDGVDATSLTRCLRKKVKVGRADIIKVEPVEEKAAAAAPQPTEASSSNPVPEWAPPGWYPTHHHGYGYCCPRTGVFYPYPAGHCYVEDSDDGSCSVM